MMFVERLNFFSAKQLYGITVREGKQFVQASANTQNGDFETKSSDSESRALPSHHDCQPAQIIQVIPKPESNRIHLLKGQPAYGTVFPL